MQIFGRDVPAPEDIWHLYSQIVQAPEIWNPDTFKDAATKCSLRRIHLRERYFSFSGKPYVTGQAPIVEGFVEEIRLFIGREPKDLTEALFKKDRRKHRKLASEYSGFFLEKLGPSRRSNDNDIFEYNGHRLRILANGYIWVVISNLSVLKKLSNDWWA